MNNGGIISQYGFLFQKMVFILHMLENINRDGIFSFEKKDDIDIQYNDSLYGIGKKDSFLIQVKSGNISNDCFNKVICNWLLLQNFDEYKYLLFTENGISNDKSVESVVDYIKSGKDSSKNSIKRKVFDLYDDEELLKNNIKNILEKLEIKKCSMSEIDLELEEIFYKDYCNDIINYGIAKKKRLNRFINYIGSQIDEAIKKKSSYSISYSEIIRMILKICDEISDKKYKVDALEFKNKLKSQAVDIVNDGKIREVKQLKLVNKADGFVVGGIVNELFYKDFRETYVEHKKTEINNIEYSAKDNYDSAVYELDEGALPKDLYNLTISKEIKNNFLPAGSYYEKGVYIFLTGDNVNDDLKITWGDEDEI